MQTLNFTLNELLQVKDRIEPFIHKTPIVTSKILNRETGAELFFKCESFQKTGSFKIRGATNAILSLTGEEVLKGVVTHSSGNFAQALSKAANLKGIKAWIVMPENAPKSKKEAVKSYGGIIVECLPTLKSRENTANEIVEKNGATFIHPYNQREVIAGQATCAIEIYQEIDSPDYIVVPVGGGGLISGTALATQCFSPQTKIIAAEPKGADDCFRSLQQGTIIPMESPKTIADGLRTGLGDLTFPIIQKYVSDVITVSEDDIIHAMKLFWTRAKIVIEPSSAVALAAVLISKERFVKKSVTVILTGGNVDIDNLPF